jgi:DNA-binding protein HU-beta
MTKKQFVSELAKKTGMTKVMTKMAVDSMIELITETLEKGENVTFVGFGSFKVVQRAARRGKDPRTQEDIEIPARKVPVFKAGKNLKEAVRD